ncbi:MAG TPA: AEC family transporter [Clostridia bacterium]|jgi:predicted permease|nr:AEC family transporter [Clostridia bacterium]
MTQIIAILKTVLPVFVLLLIGHFARRWRILTQDGVDGLKSIVIKVMLPIVQFRAFLQVHIGTDMLLITLGVFLVCLIGLFVGRMSLKVFRNAANYERFLFASFEVGMLGYALYIILFGNAQIANFATVAFGQELYVFLIMVPALQMSDGKKPTVKDAALSILKTPILIAIFAGIIGSIAGLGALLNRTAAGDVLYGVMEFASAPTAALMLIVIGYGLDFEGIDWRFTARAVLGRAVFLALGCFALVSILKLFLPLSPELIWAFVILFLLPPSYIIPFFLKDDRDVRKLSTYLSIYTTLSIAAFFVIVVLNHLG